MKWRRCVWPISTKYWRASFRRGFHRLGAAGHEVHVIEISGGRIGQRPGQRLGHLGGEERRMRVGNGVHLRLDRLDHARVAVTETGNRRAARSVEVAPAIAVDQFDALAANGDRQGLLRLRWNTCVMVRCGMRGSARKQV
jgi:hypothetical protein